MHDRRGTWRIAHQQAETVFVEQELELIGDVAGLSVAVLGSGDNLAVFALAGMGARVTSVDISSGQLGFASQRAAELGLDVTFLEADVTDLSPLDDASFDLVYTGGHVGYGSPTSEPITARRYEYCVPIGCCLSTNTIRSGEYGRTRTQPSKSDCVTSTTAPKNTTHRNT